MGKGNSKQGLYYSVILKILTWDGYVVPTNAMGTKEYRWQQCFINRYTTICGSHSYKFVYALDVSRIFIVHWYMCRSGNEGPCCKCTGRASYLA